MRDKFLDAATRDFGEDHESVYVAKEMLKTHLRADGQGELKALTQALQKNPKSGRRWRRCFYMLVLLISLPLIVLHSMNYLRLAGPMGIINPKFAESLPSLENTVTGDLSDKERMILFGDRSKKGEALQMKALWDLDSSNSAYYIEYAMAYQNDYKGLPRDFMEQSNKIDPENGWYDFALAGVKSQGAVEALARKKGARRVGGARPKWKVLDEARCRVALDTFYQVTSKPQFTEHRRSLFVQRIKILPEAYDYASQMALQDILMQSSSYVGRSFVIIHLRNLIAAEAYRCEMEKDTAALKKLISCWEYVGHGLNEDSVTYFDVIIARYWMTQSLPNIKAAALACGMVDESNRMAKLEAKFEAINERNSLISRRARSESKRGVQKRGFLHQPLEVWSRGLGRYFKIITDADLRPGRMLDYSSSGRGFSTLASVLMLLLGGVTFAFRFRAGYVVRRLSETFVDLMRPVDWVWLLGGGVLVPCLYFWTIVSLSFMSDYDENVYFGLSGSTLGPVHLLMPFIGLVFLLFILPVLIAQWRMSKRGQVLRFSQNRWMWIVPVCPVVAMPIYGIPLWDPSVGGYGVYVTIALYGVALAWSLSLAILVLLTQPKRILNRMVISRLLLSAWAASALVLIISASIHHALERYWVKNDWMVEISENEPSFNRYEYRLTKQARDEWRKILETNRERSDD